MSEALDLEAIRDRVKHRQAYIDAFPRGYEQHHADTEAMLAAIDRVCKVHRIPGCEPTEYDMGFNEAIYRVCTALNLKEA